MVANDSKTYSRTQGNTLPGNTETSHAQQDATASSDAVNQLVDARGLSCPMPLLKAKLALNGCEVGERVRILATDPGSVRDFHAFAELSVHSLLQFAEHDGEYDYLMEKGELS